MRQLEGRTCIITGGAGSLGRATARLFLEQGARLSLVDRDQAALEEAAAAMPVASELELVVADVSDAAQTEAYVRRTTERFGRVDVLFSNAGNFGVVAPIETYPEDVFDSVAAGMCAAPSLPQSTLFRR